MLSNLNYLKVWIVFICFILFAFTAQSQLFTFSEKLISKGVSRNDNRLGGYLRYKKVYYNVASAEDFLPLIFLDWKENKKYFKDCTFSYPGNLTVDSCTFYKDTAVFNKINFGDCWDVNFVLENLQITNSIFKRDLEINNVSFKRSLIIDSIYDEQDWGLLKFRNDSMEYFSLNNISNCNLLMDSCYFGSNSISFNNSKYTKAEFSNSTSQDSTLNLTSSKSKVFYNFLENNAIKYVDLESNRDTILGLKSNISTRFIANFKQSFIQGVYYLNSSKTINLNFYECEFSNAAIDIDDIDTLEIENCIVQNSLQLWNWNPEGNKRIAMRFKSMDISKIDFEYRKQMSLFFRDESFDEVNSLYQSLLSKFQREGKLVSYQNLDIEYQKLVLERKGLFGRFWSYLNEWWWNYGYDRNKIILHTFIFLGLFYITNLILGNKFVDFYPILLFDRKLKKKSFINNAIRNIIQIFILTAFIFFSLKIDFSKVNANNTRMLLYFFFQYFIGLICLFFLFNAILKI